jgi:hypothetical protein
MAARASLQSIRGLVRGLEVLGHPMDGILGGLCHAWDE